MLVNDAAATALLRFHVDPEALTMNSLSFQLQLETVLVSTPLALPTNVGFPGSPFDTDNTHRSEHLPQKLWEPSERKALECLSLPAASSPFLAFWLWRHLP